MKRCIDVQGLECADVSRILGIRLVRFLFCSAIGLTSGLTWGLIPSVARAGTASRLPASNFVGVRPAAMGQAFTAVADDQNALYYNPAGLARLEQFSLELISPILGVNQNLINNTQKVRELTGTSSGNRNKIINDLEPILDSISGENHYLRAGITPSFVMKNFGLGAVLQTEAELVPHAQVVPTIVDFSFQGDIDLRVGLANQFLGDKLAVGGALAYKERSQILLDNFGFFDLTEVSKSEESRKKYVQELLRSGWGVAADAGILFTPVPTWKPTLGLSVLNIGDVAFRSGGLSAKQINKNSSTEAGTPTRIPQSVNLGASVTPTWGKWLVRAAFDYRDANLPIPASQKPSLGFEGGWRGKYVSALAQTGVSEGYLSGGFELRLFLVNLRYATYVTERGYFPTQAPERRHLVQMKVLL